MCEADLVTAGTHGADLSYLVDAKGHEISALVGDDPNTTIAESDEKTVLLIAPRLWTSLSRESQVNPRVFAANYVIKADDMTALGNDPGRAAARWQILPKGKDMNSTVVLKSTVADAHELSLAPIVIDEIRLVGSRCGPFSRALQALERGEVDVGCLIDACYDFDQAIAAFEHAGRRGALKVLLKAQTRA